MGPDYGCIDGVLERWDLSYEGNGSDVTPYCTGATRILVEFWCLASAKRTSSPSLPWLWEPPASGRSLDQIGKQVSFVGSPFGRSPGRNCSGQSLLGSLSLFPCDCVLVVANASP